MIREKATSQQIAEMLEDLENYIKLAVDVERGILAGGGTRGFVNRCGRLL